MWRHKAATAAANVKKTPSSPLYCYCCCPHLSAGRFSWTNILITTNHNHVYMSSYMCTYVWTNWDQIDTSDSDSRVWFCGRPRQRKHNFISETLLFSLPALRWCHWCRRCCFTTFCFIDFFAFYFYHTLIFCRHRCCVSSTATFARSRSITTRIPRFFKIWNFRALSSFHSSFAAAAADLSCCCCCHLCSHPPTHYISLIPSIK